MKTLCKEANICLTLYRRILLTDLWVFNCPGWQMHSDQSQLSAQTGWRLNYILLNCTQDPLNPEQLRVSTPSRYPCASHGFGDKLWISLTPVEICWSFDPLTVMFKHPIHTSISTHGAHWPRWASAHTWACLQVHLGKNYWDTGCIITRLMSQHEVKRHLGQDWEL